MSVLIEDDDQLAVFSFIYLQNMPGGLYISELISKPAADFGTFRNHTVFKVITSC